MADKSYMTFVPDPGELPTSNAQGVFEPPVDIRLVPDLAREMPPLKPVHGVTNYAPLGSISQAWPTDVRRRLQELHIPCAYFHDDPYGSNGKDIIDVSRIFPSLKRIPQPCRIP